MTDRTSLRDTTWQDRATKACQIADNIRHAQDYLTRFRGPEYEPGYSDPPYIKIASRRTNDEINEFLASLKELSYDLYEEDRHALMEALQIAFATVKAKITAMNRRTFLTCLLALPLPAIKLPAKASKLHIANAIDRQQLLDAIQYPSSKAVKQRMDEMHGPCQRIR